MLPPPSFQVYIYFFQVRLVWQTWKNQQAQLWQLLQRRCSLAMLCVWGGGGAERGWDIIFYTTCMCILDSLFTVLLLCVSVNINI